MHVLVTGHRGYIGCILVPLMLRHGYHVLGMDSDLYRDSTFGRLELDVPESRKDIRDAEIADFHNVDAVVHLAGLSNDPLGEISPDVTYEINTAATARLAALARDAGVRRFVFSSSCSTYGAAGSDLLTEAAPLNPVTHYGTSKVLAEKALLSLSTDRFSPTILRNATAYGASPRIRFDLVVNNLVAWALTTRRVFLKSDGQSWRPLVHIEDISRAIVAVLDAPMEKVHNAIFNVGDTNENYRVLDIAELVSRAIPNTSVEFSNQAGADTRNYRVSTERMSRTLPDARAKRNVAFGVRELVETISSNGLELDDFEGPRFNRVRHIRQLIESGRLTKSLRWQDDRCNS
ncbi:MAG: SDR family oxidoreductase [Rhodothermia bacterium]|nr:SDR family oxidoreductase [Rhodothermia bacterium]